MNVNEMDECVIDNVVFGCKYAVNNAVNML